MINGEVMYVRHLSYTVTPGQADTFTVVQQHAAALYRRHGLVRFLLLSEPDAPEKITELQIYYDKEAYQDAITDIEADPMHANVAAALDEATGGTRSEDGAAVHTLILDIGGAARG